MALLCTPDVAKTEGLKQALDKYKFDVVFGGARRDEEKSGAKERILFNPRQEPPLESKNQRPELWDIYNTRKSPEQHSCLPPPTGRNLIFGNISIKSIFQFSLYFSKRRPVVVRNGMILMVDDGGSLPDEECLRGRCVSAL